MRDRFATVFATTLTTTPGSTAELRSLEPWQAEEFAAHMDRAREHIRPWVGPSFVTDDVDGARATLQRYADATAHDGNRIFGIWVTDPLVEPVETKPTSTLVGGVMFVEFSAAAGTCEIGCWLEPAAEGRGLISAACRMLLTYAFEERGLHRAEWRCRADNARSSAVAARLGMTLEGVLREAWKSNGSFHDKQVWSMLAGEYKLVLRAVLRQATSRAEPRLGPPQKPELHQRWPTRSGFGWPCEGRPHPASAGDRCSARRPAERLPRYRDRSPERRFSRGMPWRHPDG